MGRSFGRLSSRTPPISGISRSTPKKERLAARRESMNAGDSLHDLTGPRERPPRATRARKFSALNVSSSVSAPCCRPSGQGAQSEDQAAAQNSISGASDGGPGHSSSLQLRDSHDKATPTCQIERPPSEQPPHGHHRRVRAVRRRHRPRGSRSSSDEDPQQHANKGDTDSNGADGEDRSTVARGDSLERPLDRADELPVIP